MDGLDYIHDHNVVHCDCKPENVLISDGVAKICDFGSAMHLGDSYPKLVGSLAFLPPELAFVYVEVCVSLSFIFNCSFHFSCLREGSITIKSYGHLMMFGLWELFLWRC